MKELGSRRHIPGKVFDTWTYKVKDVELPRIEYVPKDEREEGEPKTRETKERVVNKVVTVELRIEKTTTQSEEPPHPLETVKLYAVCKELDISIEGTDVEALRAAMWGKLDKRYEIQWEKYFLVRVDHQAPYQGLGTGIVVSYDDVYKGTTWDGKLLLRRWSYREEKIETWPGVFKEKGGKVLACIPATESNEQALKEFVRRVNLLREKMAEFLKPENIVATLNNLSGLALLPQPEPMTPEMAKRWADS